jgi:hypothetical protein
MAVPMPVSLRSSQSQPHHILGNDYMPVSGTLTFRPDDTHQHIPIEIIDDDVFEEDEHFCVVLENLRVRTRDGAVIDPTQIAANQVPIAELLQPTIATVMILGKWIGGSVCAWNSSDDDHAGVFIFEKPEVEVVETNGHAKICVKRTSGARGKVECGGQNCHLTCVLSRFAYPTEPIRARPSQALTTNKRTASLNLRTIRLSCVLVVHCVVEGEEDVETERLVCITAHKCIHTSHFCLMDARQVPVTQTSDSSPRPQPAVQVRRV